MGWTIQGSDAGGSQVFRNIPRFIVGLTQPGIRWLPGRSCEYSDQGLALTADHNLAPKLKKE